MLALLRVPAAIIFGTSAATINRSLESGWPRTAFASSKRICRIGTCEKAATNEFEQSELIKSRSSVESDILGPRSPLARLLQLSIGSILHEKETHSTQAGEAAP